MDNASNIPYDQGAEEATIGAILINPDAYIRVAVLLKEDDFYVFRHRLIWQAFTAMKSAGREIDYLTVASHLKEAGVLNDSGGPAYLTQLINATPDSSYVMGYANVVERMAVRRKLLAAAQKIKALAEDGSKTVEEATEASMDLLRQAASRNSYGQFKTWRESVQEYWDLVDSAYTTGKPITGLPTGLRDLDAIIDGMHPEEFIVIAGRPGMGKSALALSIIVNQFERNPDTRIGMFSLEMSNEQLVQRMNSMVSGVNLKTVRSATMSAVEYKRFVEANGKIANYPLLPRDTSGLSMERIRSYAHEWRMERGGLSLVVIDYLQLMIAPEHNGKGRKMQNENDEITYLSKSCKELARELKIPVIALSQLNRNLESRRDKRPQKSDLRGSGSIEQDADKIIFVHRPEVYDETAPKGAAELIVDKHRNGETGMAMAYYHAQQTRFMNAQVRSIDI